MPALKRARPASLASPTSPTPRPRVLSSLPVLRPSLRQWREGSVVSATSSDSEAEDIEVGCGETEDEGGLSTLPEEGGDSDGDAVDASLASLAPRSPLTPANTKGKGVDPREYGLRDTKVPVDAPSAPERVLKRRIPKQAKAFLSRRRTGRRIPSTLNLRNPRRIVSPTESVFAITNRIDSLGTDEQDEQDVQHTLLPDDADDEGSSPPPQSPSPAPPSDTETDEPVSPLASKSRRAAARKRRLRKHAKAADEDQHDSKRKRTRDTEDDRVEAVRALQSLASAAGFRLVPLSPGGEPMDADSAPEPEFIVPGPVQAVPFGEQLPVPEKPAVRTIVHHTTVETAHEPQHDTPRKRKAAEPAPTAEPPVTRARQRYAATVPKSKEPVTPLGRRKRHEREARSTLPRSVGPETSHLHRTSPTSLIPSRHKLRVKPRTKRVRFARRPVVLHRAKRASAFVSWSATDDNVPVLPGALYAAALRDRAVTHRVRASLLNRYRERVFPSEFTSTALPTRPASSHRRQRSDSATSASDDEQVEALLPSDDVEMLDSEVVDAALSPSRERSPSVSLQNRPLKRPATWRTNEAASRRAVHAAQHTAEMDSFAKSIRFHLVTRREKRAAVKEHAAARVRAAVAAALAAVEEERRAEEAELARLAVEAQAELDAENARLQALAEAEAARVNAEAQARAQARRRVGAAHRRRRAADSVAAQLEVRPRTRLAGDRHRAELSLRRPVPVPRVSVEPEPEPEPQAPVPVVEDEEPVAGPSVPTGLRSPVQLNSSPTIPSPAPPQLDLEVADDPAPPRYEYPFFPIIRPAPPAHLRPVPATPPRQFDLEAVSPPAYVPNRYSRRTPSPPPPYNALTDRDTLVHPVFMRGSNRANRAQRQERERERVLERQRAAATQMRIRIEEELVEAEAEGEADSDEEMRDEWENGENAHNVGGHDNGPAGATDAGPIFGVIRRFFGW